MDDIDNTLKERGSRYGKFDQHAYITQGLKLCMHNDIGWSRLSPSQKECLDMVQHKIGRIINGDPNYLDSWVDIIGYTKLVIDELENVEKMPKV